MVMFGDARRLLAVGIIGVEGDEFDCITEDREG